MATPRPGALRAPTTNSRGVLGPGVESPRSRQKGPRWATLAKELEGANKRGEFFVLYQPQIDLVTGLVSGVEALMRWNHPRHGLVSPAEFIPIAEASGHIVSLGAWILQEACTQANRWRNTVLAQTATAVNVSVVQLNQLDFVDAVARILKKTGLPAQRLVLEVTENEMVQRGDRAFLALRALRAAGVHIAIDDFGTGYSCLSYLRDLPSNALKIDQSFVQKLSGHSGAAAVAQAIVALGRSLGLRVVAEGIETLEQEDFLKSIWCDEGQGFLYARPMTADQTEAWAEAWPRRYVEIGRLSRQGVRSDITC
ncbi:MAG: EAL domain-containing protein [Xanthobacteraceae bacterium]|nr:EAL domain-containing protein [Xanthobacteraceae bacterium]